MSELLAVFKAKLKQANVASAPVHWTFGGSVALLFLDKNVKDLEFGN